MIRNIHSRSIWRRQILQSHKINFEKRGHGQLRPHLGNKMLELSPVGIDQEHIRMSNNHQHKKKYGSKGSNSIKTSSPDLWLNFQFYNQSKIKHITNQHLILNKTTRNTNQTWFLIQTRYWKVISSRPSCSKLRPYNYIPEEFILNKTVIRPTKLHFGTKRHPWCISLLLGDT